MLKDILQPINVDAIKSANNYEYNQFANRLIFFDEKFPKLSNVNVAIIGVPEDRCSYTQNASTQGIQSIRKELYKLFYNFNNCVVADLGNIIPSKKVKDTYHAVEIVCKELKEKNIIPIFIGGSQDLTKGQLLGSIRKNQLLNFCVVDEKIDMYDNAESYTNKSFLYDLLEKKGKHIFNLNIMACQQHLIDSLIEETYKSLGFSTLRLGKIRQDIQEVEPVLRASNFLSIDLAAVKQADAPGVYQQSPNGLTSFEICQIARYAGMSDKMESIGIYDYFFENDFNEQTAQLSAQIIWYFIQGIENRKQELELNLESSLKYIVSFTESDHSIEFFKSTRSDRWWMKVPLEKKRSKKLKQLQMVPCSYKDYLQACNEEIPELWLSTFLKLNE